MHWFRLIKISSAQSENWCFHFELVSPLSSICVSNRKKLFQSSSIYYFDSETDTSVFKNTCFIRCCLKLAFFWKQFRFWWTVFPSEKNKLAFESPLSSSRVYLCQLITVHTGVGAAGEIVSFSGQATHEQRQILELHIQGAPGWSHTVLASSPKHTGMWLLSELLLSGTAQYPSQGKSARKRSQRLHQESNTDIALDVISIVLWWCSPKLLQLLLFSGFN